MDMSYAILREVEKSRLINKGDKILIGVSGGVDSVVLLDVLYSLSSKTGFEIAVAHVNHAMRGSESNRDERFVKELAAKKGLKYYSTRLCDLKNSGENLQNFARKLRYAFLEKTAKKIGANKIALAHHADDQAETVLQHLIRGCGLAGLSGMAPSSSPPLMGGDKGEGDIVLVRPLLSFTKKELLIYAKERKLKFVQDSTNKTKKYHRNVIRHDLLPLLQKYNPNAVKSLCKTAAILRDENEVLDDIATRALVRLCVSSLVKPTNQIAFKRSSFIKHSIAIRRRMLRLAYAKLTGGTADLLTDHIDKMMWIISSGEKKGSYCLPKVIKFVKRGEMIIFAKIPVV